LRAGPVAARVVVELRSCGAAVERSRHGPAALGRSVMPHPSLSQGAGGEPGRRMVVPPSCTPEGPRSAVFREQRAMGARGGVYLDALSHPFFVSLLVRTPTGMLVKWYPSHKTQ